MATLGCSIRKRLTPPIMCDEFAPGTSKPRSGKEHEGEPPKFKGKSKRKFTCVDCAHIMLEAALPVAK
jgi:hypothetical protein